MTTAYIIDIHFIIRNFLRFLRSYIRRKLPRLVSKTKNKQLQTMSADKYDKKSNYLHKISQNNEIKIIIPQGETESLM